MSTPTMDRIFPYEMLAGAPVGTRFIVDNKLFTLAEGSEVEYATGEAWFNATGRGGVAVKVRIGPRSSVGILSRRH